MRNAQKDTASVPEGIHEMTADQCRHICENLAEGTAFDFDDQRDEEHTTTTVKRMLRRPM